MLAEVAPPAAPVSCPGQQVHSGHATDSIAAWQPVPSGSGPGPLQLHLHFSQLQVDGATSADAIAPPEAPDMQPPLYHYYLQLRTADGAMLAGLPMLMAPTEHLALWQARQAAESPGPSKKGAKKPAAPTKGKIEPAKLRKTWYTEVNTNRHAAMIHLPSIYCLIMRPRLPEGAATTETAKLPKTWPIEPRSAKIPCDMCSSIQFYKGHCF